MLKKTKLPYTPFQPTLTVEGQTFFDIHVTLKRPSLRLSPSIYAFVQVRTRSQTVYPVIPDGTNILFFSQCKETFGGTQKSILEVPLNTENAEYFGIWFYPGNVRSFFNIDLSDVSDDLVGLDFLEDTNWLFLNEQLAECVGFDQRVQLCENLLLKKQSETHFEQRFHRALQLIYKANGHIPIQALAEQVGYSQRHLNRYFQLNTGLSAKAFSQTIRMNEFLKRCYHSEERHLEHGLDLGFYDQSHLQKSIERQGLDQLSLQARRVMSSFYNP